MTYSNLNYHIVFSTKNRKTFLKGEVFERLCQYIIGICNRSKAKLFIVNGISDHIHLAISLNPDTKISDFMRRLKANTSKWIHETFLELEDFGWQDGYSVFSVSYSGLNKVIEYIKNQQKHHKQMDFKEELIALFKRHNINYNEAYI